MWRQLQQLGQLMPDAGAHPHTTQVRAAEAGAAEPTGRPAGASPHELLIKDMHLMFVCSALGLCLHG
jgi:hypothetical protein